MQTIKVINNKQKLKIMKTIQQKKYFQNLYTDNKNIYSYETNVATIDHEKNKVIVSDWWSVTTLKHINYIANLLGYEVIKNY